MYSAAVVLRLQATAGNRATAQLLQRSELPDALAKYDVAKYPNNWTTSDRKNNTQQWQDACDHNLRNLKNGEYTHIAERRDFYKWFYETTADKGFETRWALAAYIVAGGMAEMSEVDYTEGLSPITNELQGLARIGNQVIFDDVLPKLRALYLGPPLKGEHARKKDQEILAEEQNLIQNLYTGLSPETMKRFEGMANMTYTRASIGQFFGMGGNVEKGRYNIKGEVPTFSQLVPGGDIRKPEDRWKYGMALAEKMSTLPNYGPVDAMPAVGADYQGSAQFDRLNVRPNLHMIDARLNDTVMPHGEIVGLLKKLTPFEQRDIESDTWRMVRLRHLYYSEMMSALENLPDMRVSTKLLLLEFALMRSWTSVDYKEIKPLITLAKKHQPDDLKLLHGDRWKKVFIDICTDDNVEEAVSDIGLPADKAAEWVKAEKAWL